MDPKPSTRLCLCVHKVFGSWISAGRVHLVSISESFLFELLLTFSRYFPRLLYYISIPVRKNAPLLPPNTTNKRWPVMVFSHGLGGSRNAYSHLVGSIASHGMIVIAPEHRDGSTPISYIRDVPSNNSVTEKSAARKARRTRGPGETEQRTGVTSLPQYLQLRIALSFTIFNRINEMLV